MGMIFEMTEQEILTNLLDDQEWTMPEITADYNDDWDE